MNVSGHSGRVSLLDTQIVSIGEAAVNGRLHAGDPGRPIIGGNRLGDLRQISGSIVDDDGANIQSCGRSFGSHRTETVNGKLRRFVSDDYDGYVQGRHSGGS